MKILYDHQIFELQRIGGISRYFYEVIKGNNCNDYLSLEYSNNIYAKKLEYPVKSMNIEKKDLFPKHQFRGKGRINKYYNKLKKTDEIDMHLENIKKSQDFITNYDYDIFHPTYYDNYFLSELRKPFVITIYDLIHEVCPGYFSLNDPAFINKKKLAIDSNRIIAISKSTKNDLVKFYDIDSEKIDVVYLSSSIKNNKQEAPKEKLPSSYILYTGSRAIYKNFYFFLEAICPILKANPELNLVCTGSDFTKEEKDFFRMLDIESNIFSYFIKNDSELAYLYSNAITFVFPSLYEGFGMPILEAYECRCPVLLSDTPCFKEIGGNAAVYFDPYSIESIRKKISEVIFSNTKRQEMIALGVKISNTFSWEETINQTKKVYQRVLEQY